MKSEHSRGHDWPISYEDVAPFYDKIAEQIGVSGDAKAEEPWRPAGKPYPMPPMKVFPAGKVWLKGGEATGIRFIPMANGMNSTQFKGRDACIYDGWCAVGCPIGALANPLVTYLGEARKAGAEVRALSNVTRVLTDQTGRRAIGVEYYDAKKERQVQEASVVVLAAWSARNSCRMTATPRRAIRARSAHPSWARALRIRPPITRCRAAICLELSSLLT